MPTPRLVAECPVAELHTRATLRNNTSQVASMIEIGWQESTDRETWSDLPRPVRRRMSGVCATYVLASPDGRQPGYVILAWPEWPGIRLFCFEAPCESQDAVPRPRRNPAELGRPDPDIGDPDAKEARRDMP